VTRVDLVLLVGAIPFSPDCWKVIKILKCNKLIVEISAIIWVY
jgi:hypothetical protein